MKMLDLFSGLGGASEAMLANGWDVKRIEVNKLLQGVPNTEMKDINDLAREIEEAMAQGYKPDQIKLVWASPPCTDFSLGYASKRSKAIRAGEEYHPGTAIELVKTAKHIIDMIQPQYWCIENVRGSIKYLKPILGEPAMIAGPYVLWGRFPAFDVDMTGYSKMKGDTWSTDPLRANRRALVPYNISDGLRKAIENQKTLDYWF